MVSIIDDSSNKTLNIVKEIISGKKTIGNFVEELSESLTNLDPDKRESSIKFLSDVIEALPSNILIEDEIVTLLKFYFSKLEDKALLGAPIVKSINILVTKCENFPISAEISQLTFTKLCRDNPVNLLIRNDRFFVYKILQFLLNKPTVFDPLGSDFVWSFLEAIEGERDPECLLLTFNLFQTVVAHFNLGAFCTDAFDIVACYFPINFDQSKSESDVTSSDLSASLQSCLLSHPEFSNSVIDLVVEKLKEAQDEEQETDEVRRKTFADSLRLWVAAQNRFKSKDFTWSNLESLWSAMCRSFFFFPHFLDSELIEESCRSFASVMIKLELVEKSSPYSMIKNVVFEQLMKRYWENGFLTTSSQILSVITSILAENREYCTELFNDVCRKYIELLVGKLKVSLEKTNGAQVQDRLLSDLRTALAVAHPIESSTLESLGEIMDLYFSRKLPNKQIILLLGLGEFLLSDHVNFKAKETIIRHIVRIFLENYSLSKNLEMDEISLVSLKALSKIPCSELLSYLQTREDLSIQNSCLMMLVSLLSEDDSILESVLKKSLESYSIQINYDCLLQFHRVFLMAVKSNKQENILNFIIGAIDQKALQLNKAEMSVDISKSKKSIKNCLCRIYLILENKSKSGFLKNSIEKLRRNLEFVDFYEELFCSVSSEDASLICDTLGDQLKDLIEDQTISPTTSTGAYTILCSVLNKLQQNDNLLQFLLTYARTDDAEMTLRRLTSLSRSLLLRNWAPNSHETLKKAFDLVPKIDDVDLTTELFTNLYSNPPQGFKATLFYQQRIAKESVPIFLDSFKSTPLDKRGKFISLLPILLNYCPLQRETLEKITPVLVAFLKLENCQRSQILNILLGFLKDPNLKRVFNPHMAQIIDALFENVEQSREKKDLILIAIIIKALAPESSDSDCPPAIRTKISKEMKQFLDHPKRLVRKEFVIARNLWML